MDPFVEWRKAASSRRSPSHLNSPGSSHRLDATAIAQVQARVRQRLLRVFVRRGLLPSADAREYWRSKNPCFFH